jgi:hypothetical protein
LLLKHAQFAPAQAQWSHTSTAVCTECIWNALVVSQPFFFTPSCRHKNPTPRKTTDVAATRKILGVFVERWRLGANSRTTSRIICATKTRCGTKKKQHIAVLNAWSKTNGVANLCADRPFVPPQAHVRAHCAQQHNAEASGLSPVTACWSRQVCENVSHEQLTEGERQQAHHGPVNGCNIEPEWKRLKPANIAPTQK